MHAEAALSPHRSYLVVAIGIVLPALLTIVNGRLAVERNLLPLMTALVLEVGLLGVLCARLVRPLWLACLIYGWAWLVMDMHVVAFATRDEWSGIVASNNTLAAALLSGQLGLIAIWFLLGQTRWSLRWPLALFFATAVFVPLVWHGVRPTNLLIVITLQTALLVLVCGVMRVLGYHLTLHLPDRAFEPSSDHPQQRPIRRSQFQTRDVLLWMTSIAMALAAARAAGYWPVLLEAWQETINQIRFRGVFVIFHATPRMAFFSAMLLVLAMWAALGRGRASRRWAVLIAATLALATVTSYLEFHSLTRTWGRGVPPWDPMFWQLFWYYEWATFAWLLLCSAMLFAALLFPRTLGYRLVQLHRSER